MEEEIQSLKRRIYWYVPRIPVLLAIALIGLAASLVCLFLLNQAQALFSGAHKSLLLTPQQIADDQQSPPLAFNFPRTASPTPFPSSPGGWLLHCSVLEYFPWYSLH